MAKKVVGEHVCTIDTKGYKEGPVPTGKIVAFDLETTSLKMMEPTTKVLSLAYTSKEGQAGVLLKPKKSNAPDFLTDPRVTKVAAGRPFDEVTLKKKLGLKIVGPIVDVLTMGHVINENFGPKGYNLENLANVYTPLQNIKDMAEGKRDDLGSVSKKILVNYNSVDADATIRLFNVFRSKISGMPEVQRYYKHFIMPIQDMLADVYHNGVRINKDKLKKNEEWVVSRMEKLHETAIKCLPKEIRTKYAEDLNLGRPIIATDYLFNVLKRKPHIFTEKTLKPSTSEEHLMMFSKVPFIKHRIDWVKLRKIQSSFLTNMWDCINSDDRVYPSTLLNVTVTGRSIITSPAIQTIPKRNPYADRVREIFEPEEGWLFGERDLAQSEVRIMGWRAQDQKILQALRDGIDIHTLTASIVNGIPLKDVTKEMRQKAKAIVFGFLYGMSAGGFQNYARSEYGLNFTLAECGAIRETFFKGYWGLPIFHTAMENECRKYGFITSPLGRRRRLQGIYAEEWATQGNAKRQAINFPIQSFSSDLGFIGMYCFWQEVKNKKDIKINWFIHDSVVFQCKADKMSHYQNLLDKCMCRTSKEYIKEHFGLDVNYPIESSGKWGVNWAMMKDLS